ncbi:MAG: hypothetical protein AAF652_15525 [Cyanobacteria bacterium P01_C01_bin.72]
MTNDALERLRNRKKPKVESRDLAEALPTSDSLTASNNLDVEISTQTDISKSSSLLPNQNEQNAGEIDFATKQTTIRLEKQILQRICQVCQESEISREVLLEALFVNFENQQSVQPKVIKEARKRDERRKEIANQRRAKSMIKRYG